MTHYDKLIDSIKHELYQFYCSNYHWSESDAAHTSHKILKIVEEFQTTRSLIKQWRASD